MKSKVLLFVISALLIGVSATAVERQRKEIYLDLMEEAARAYTSERIEDYIARVDRDGIHEHGFPRLASNIGILVAKGRLPQYKDLFVRMMDLAVREVPVAREKNGHRGEIGNEFSVRELIGCILECEKSGLFPKEQTDSWRRGLSDMKSEDIYRYRPEAGNPVARNWCVYGAASECARTYAGVGGDMAYAEKYLSDQLRFFDDNGMYRDPGSPIVYDLATRLQYMAALHFGYDGPSKVMIEHQFLKSVLPTLAMQSVTGEIPYGGRSIGFLHNEAAFAAVCEYYASWMKERGEMALASRFKAAARCAAESIFYWTSQKPVRHIKNRFPSETGYGCERYAHFDKYMITMASSCYLAYLFADDTIQPARHSSYDGTFVTSRDFHLVVMNAGGYTVQLDLNANGRYDSSGLGRFQRRDYSPVAGLHSPAPASVPNYKTDIPVVGGLSLSPGWDNYILKTVRKRKVVLTNGEGAFWTIRLSRRGLSMTLEGEGIQTLNVPAFAFDGEKHSDIHMEDGLLKVSFAGADCIWTSSGKFAEMEHLYATRTGHLRHYQCSADGRIRLKGKIR